MGKTFLARVGGRCRFLDNVVVGHSLVFKLLGKKTRQQCLRCRSTRTVLCASSHINYLEN